MPDGLKADAKLGFGIAIGLFAFAILLAIGSMVLGKIKR